MCFCEILFLKASNIIKPHRDIYSKSFADKSVKSKCYDEKQGKLQPKSKNKDQEREEMWASKSSLSEMDVTPGELEQKQVKKLVKTQVRSNGLSEVNSR